MDSHRITGGLEEVVGAAEEQAAKLTGDRAAGALGAIRRARGQVERRFGATLDSIRDDVRDRPLLTVVVVSAIAILGASIIGRKSPADAKRPAAARKKR